MNIHKWDYWSWAYSDFLSNTNRAVFWEFLVAKALWISESKRIEWDNVDLRYLWKKIEVKTSAYLQSWEQKWISRIQFDIAPRKKSWDSVTNVISESRGRESDIYIFCLLELLDKAEAIEENILNVNNWWFYVTSTGLLNSEFPNQKSISFSKLATITKRIDFQSLKSTIDLILI